MGFSEFILELFEYKRVCSTVLCVSRATRTVVSPISSLVRVWMHKRACVCNVSVECVIVCVICNDSLGKIHKTDTRTVSNLFETRQQNHDYYIYLESNYLSTMSSNRLHLMDQHFMYLHLIQLRIVSSI